MEISIIVMTIVGISTSLISFLLGTIYGRNTAYETIRTYQAADTQDTPAIVNSRILGERLHYYGKGRRRGGEPGVGLADE